MSMVPHNYLSTANGSEISVKGKKKNYTTALKWFDFMHNNFITAEEQATSHAKQLNYLQVIQTKKRSKTTIGTLSLREY